MTLSQANSISIPYVRRLLAGAARHGVALDGLFRQCGLDPALLADDRARLPSSDLIRLMQAVMSQTEDEFLGLSDQVRSKPGSFSMMAHAVINCATLAQAIHRSASFYTLFETPIAIDFRHDNHEGSLSFRLHEAVPFDDVIQELMCFVSLRFWSWLVGRSLQPLVIEFACPMPPHAAEFQRLFRCPVVYGMEANQIRFPAAWLNLPLAQTPLSLRRFLRESLSVIIRGEGRAATVADQVRLRLGKPRGEVFPDIAVVAEQLHMSPQTLRRRLRDEGTSFQVIKDDLREQVARFYLAKPALSIEEVALMMGYSEASAFHRAFKKWTGQTPQACRQALLNAAPEPR